MAVLHVWEWRTRVARSHDRGLENVESWQAPAPSLPAARDHGGVAVETGRGTWLVGTMVVPRQGPRQEQGKPSLRKEGDPGPDPGCLH